MISVYDFFSGCGGASQGFKDAGFELRLGIDNNSDAADTYQLNFSEAAFIKKDIRELTPEEVEPYINHTSLKLFCGCAPCQPFSKQNHNKSSKDIRINLLQEFSRFVCHFLPEYIFVENVPGIQKISLGGSPLETFCTTLKRLGYKYTYGILSAADYGVPQLRKRLILVAGLHICPVFPAHTHGTKTGLPYSIVSDWIEGLPQLAAGECDASDKDHCSTRLSPLNMQRIQATPEGGGRADWVDNLKLTCHQEHKGHTDVYGRLANNKIASTLTTRCVSYSNGRYGHPTENRAISIREAALLQTFSRNFKFSGSLGARAKLVGNAVPPLLAYQFGLMFKKLN